MNTKSLEQFEVLNSEMLASVEGGKRPGGAPVTGMTQAYYTCLAATWGATFGGMLAPISLIGSVPGVLAACSGL